MVIKTNSRDLLLIIDMQEGFRCVESVDILSNILRLKNLFNGKIVLAKFMDTKDSLFEEQLNWTKFQSDENKKLFPELRNTGNVELEHSGYTVFNKELREFVDKNKISKIYLCGVYTDVCIIKTAMDLFDSGIEAFVIEDACNSLHGRSNHDSAIDSLKHILGEKCILLTQDICG